MPTYEFKCKCGHVFDDVKSVKDRRTSKCPKCSKVAKMQFIGTNKILIPACFHKPVPDSMVREAHRQNPDLERAR